MHPAKAPAALVQPSGAQCNSPPPRAAERTSLRTEKYTADGALRAGFPVSALCATPTPAAPPDTPPERPVHAAASQPASENPANPPTTLHPADAPPQPSAASDTRDGFAEGAPPLPPAPPLPNSRHPQSFPPQPHATAAPYIHKIARP